MKVSSRTTLAVIVAAVALALSATAGATASMMITGKQIKNGTVTTADIKNRSITLKDISSGAKARMQGSTGDTGARGATGPSGPQGLPGLSGFEVVTRSVSIPGLGGTDSVAAVCPAGKKAISATAGYAAPVASLLSQVTRTGDSAFSATGVNLLGSITGQLLTIDMVCAVVPS